MWIRQDMLEVRTLTAEGKANQYGTITFRNAQASQT